MPFEVNSPIGDIEILMVKGEKGDPGTAGNYNELSNKPTVNGYTLAAGTTLANIGAEASANKVTSITSSSTDTQFPSAKAVWSLVMGAIGGEY